MNPAAWTQTYDPLGNFLLSAIVAAIPVVVLLGALAFFHVKAHWAALMGLALAWAIAVFVYGMPAGTATSAALYGAAFGLLPIGWIILNAIFVYDITVKTGKFEVVKETIGGLAGDRRIQVLLIAFAFGAFIEGAAGFGTPVAISAAMLIGLGFKPLAAAGLALIGNTAPVAYGALGTPIITLAKVTGLNELALSSMVGRQLPFFSVIVPFWLIVQMSGWRGMLEVWPACLVAGLAFAIPQFVVSNHFGPSLVDIFAAASCIIALYLFLKVWQPKSIWRFPEERDTPHAVHRSHGFGSAFMGWMPWIVLSVFVFFWGLPSVKTWLNGVANPTWAWFGLHNLVNKAPPVAKAISAEGAMYSLNYLSATGTGLLLSGLVAGLWLKLSPVELLKTYFNTLKRVRFSLLTIAAMLALGFTTRYSGSDSTMGLAFASTGGLTGVEVGIAGGTAVLAQKLLEAVFGDDAVRRLTVEARERLDVRVASLLDGEAARFIGQLDALGAMQADGAPLREVVDDVVAAARAERAQRSPVPPGHAGDGRPLRGAGPVVDEAAPRLRRGFWRRLIGRDAPA